MKKIISIAMLTLFVSLPSMATHFDRMDKDQDGFISASEAKGRMKQGFDKLDTNGDGKLSKEEVAAGKNRQGGKGEKPARYNQD